MFLFPVHELVKACRPSVTIFYDYLLVFFVLILPIYRYF